MTMRVMGGEGAIPTAAKPVAASCCAAWVCSEYGELRNLNGTLARVS